MDNEQTQAIPDMMIHYRTIGAISDCVLKAPSIDVALRDGIRIIATSCQATLAAVWYMDAEGENLVPYHWLSNLDLSSKRYSTSSAAGTVFANQSTVRYLEYSEGTDPETDTILGSIQISSLLLIPFSDKKEKQGIIQFAKTNGATFTEEEADICEIFTFFLAMTLQEEEFDVRPEEKPIVLSARNIQKSYQNGDIVTQVLKGVNLDIYEGEFLAVLGESGCGKTTFLNIIAGLESADGGTFSFLGTDYSQSNENVLTKYRRDNIGFIFQSYNLMPNLTARQNLELIGELVENPMSANDVLTMVGLSDRADNYPYQLSGGQQQRVSIARSLIKRPKLIFADEPTAALDYATAIEVLGVLQQLTETGATLVVVTHNEEITRMADRIARVRCGQIYEITVNKHKAQASELVW